MGGVPRRTALVLLTALLAALAGCGGDEEAACGPVTQEALDANSGLHILPDAEPPAYASTPPTSGAHFSLEPPSGVQDEPLAEPMQVTELEIGRVLVQYRPDDLADDVAALEAYADDPGVVVAPNPDLPDPLVLTAWLTKQTCSGLDAETVEAFIAEQQGRGPGAD
jgi:Protein of unknown function (DUF3105)